MDKGCSYFISLAKHKLLTAFLVLVPVCCGIAQETYPVMTYPTIERTTLFLPSSIDYKGEIISIENSDAVPKHAAVIDSLRRLVAVLHNEMRY